MEAEFAGKSGNVITFRASNPYEDEYAALTDNWALSPSAIGLFMQIYRSRKREGFMVTVEGLRKMFNQGTTRKYGRDAIRADIAQLEEFGFLMRGQARNADGTMSSDTVYIALVNRALYDTAVGYLRSRNVYVSSKRPAIIDELAQGICSFEVAGMLNETIQIAADGSIIESGIPEHTECKTPGHNRQTEFRPSGVTWENAKIGENNGENTVKTCAKTEENESPQNSESVAKIQTIPRSQPTDGIPDVGYFATTKQDNLTSNSPTYSNFIHPSRESSQVDTARGTPAIACAPLSSSPGALPSDGRTDDERFGVSEPSSSEPAVPADSVVSPEGNPEIISAVDAMAASSVNRNRLTSTADRDELARLVVALVEAGATTTDVIEGWRDKQREAEDEGREARYYPQLMRWLANEAPAALIRKRKRAGPRASPADSRCDESPADSRCDESRLSRVIAFDLLKDQDPEFVVLVENARASCSDAKYGLVSPEEADDANRRMEAYFERHDPRRNGFNCPFDETR